MRNRAIWVLAGLMAACGGEPSGGGRADAAVAGDAMVVDAAVIDAPVADATGADAMVADASGDASGDGGPDAPLPVGKNRVFVTRAGVLGDFGGLAVADAMCAGEAAAAGLPGTFVAWLSTSTVDARDRLGAARGWVRTDGVPVADTIEDLIDHYRMFNPVDRDATGALNHGPIWTGTGPDGRVDLASTCADWSSIAPTANLGYPDAAMPDFTNGFEWDCFINGRFACFQIDQATEVLPEPDPTATRIAFVSRQARSAPGVAHLDGICAAEAASAGLPGAYKAAVATDTATIASRFTVDGRAWRRVDGTRIAGPEFLGEVEYLTSFVNQHADGGYTGTAVVAGVNRPTVLSTQSCSSWTTFSSGFYQQGRPVNTYQRYLWGAIGFVPCAVQKPVICLQE